MAYACVEVSRPLLRLHTKKLHPQRKANRKTDTKRILLRCHLHQQRLPVISLSSALGRQGGEGGGVGNCIVWQVTEESVLGPYICIKSNHLNRVYLINGDDSENIDMCPRAQIGLFGLPKRVQRGRERQVKFYLTRVVN